MYLSYIVVCKVCRIYTYLKPLIIKAVLSVKNIVTSILVAKSRFSRKN